MNPARISELMDEGYTWEEADELLSRRAEEQADAERDRQVEEKLNQGESK